MAPKEKGGEAPADTKKKRRVGIASIDPGIEANECIKIFLVSSQEEVGTTSSICIEEFDLNHFFGEDGKIYGYKDLKINVWLSCVSFHAYADVTFESSSDGGKGITDIKPALQNVFGETLVEKNEFLQTFSTEHHYIRTILSSGTVVHFAPSRGNDNAPDSHLDAENSTVEVIKMDLNSMPVGLLYSRLVPLVLLLVDGGSPIDVTDPGWEIYFVAKKTHDPLGDCVIDLLGFTTVHRFYHHPDSTRLRIGQILILPQYQHQGHGRRLLECINHVAVSENIYDVTIEDPTDYITYLRTVIDTLRLVALEAINPTLNSVVNRLKSTCGPRLGPPSSLIENVRQKLKMNKKQFLRCWEVVIYLNLDHKNRKCMENFCASVSDRLKAKILDEGEESNEGKQVIEVPNDYGHDKTFVMLRSGAGIGESNGAEGDKAIQEQQLRQLVDDQMVDIVQVSQKVQLLLDS